MYFENLIINIIGTYPEFQKIVESTCPTRWADGSICPPADDTMNKAFMEYELLVELELI